MPRPSKTSPIRRILLPLRQLVATSVNRLSALGATPSGTLVYVGMHRGDGFDRLFRHYETCHGFEANPEMYEFLVRRFAGQDRVQLHNVAACDEDGELELNISSNDGKSSSLGQFDESWGAFQSGDVRMERKVRVQGVNLHRYLESLGVDHIDLYVSDIQGMDLSVLKTLEPLIRARRIGAIQSEVTKDGHQNVYQDLAPNNFSAFEALLGEDYELAGKGWGDVKAGQFEETPDEWWEMDCLWTVKP